MNEEKFIKALIPIRGSDVILDEDIYLNALKEIENSSDNFPIVVKGEKIAETKIRIVADKEEGDILINTHVKKDGKFMPALLCDNIVAFDFFLEKPFQLNDYRLLRILEKRIIDFFIFVTVSQKGLFDIANFGFILFKDKLVYKTRKLIHSIDYSTLIADKYGWPKLSHISLKKTIDWFKQYQESLDFISTNKVGRAINAYWQLFGDSSSREDSYLFWAMVGIEALYVQGNMQIQQQVNQKSQILLGNRNEFKKKFSEMYDFRSRYIHGDLNFINQMPIEENIPTFEKFWDQSSFAICILLGSFQKMIENEIHDLDFEYVLSKK